MSKPKGTQNHLPCLGTPVCLALYRTVEMLKQATADLRGKGRMTGSPGARKGLDVGCERGCVELNLKELPSWTLTMGSLALRLRDHAPSQRHCRYSRV